MMGTQIMNAHKTGTLLMIETSFLNLLESENWARLGNKFRITCAGSFAITYMVKDLVEYSQRHPDMMANISWIACIFMKMNLCTQVFQRGDVSFRTDMKMVSSGQGSRRQQEPWISDSSMMPSGCRTECYTKTLLTRWYMCEAEEESMAEHMYILETGRLAQNG